MLINSSSKRQNLKKNFGDSKTYLQFSHTTSQNKSLKNLESIILRMLTWTKNKNKEQITCCNLKLNYNYKY